MAVLQIREIGDPVLRTETQAVEEVDDKIRNLIENMAETMYAADGVGLAAPQVGVSKKVIVVDIGEGLLSLINPEIIDSSGLVCEEEGCLSIPKQNKMVTRDEQIVVEALDKDGNQLKLEAEGLLARVLQHEIDHLNGILFIDKAE